MSLSYDAFEMEISGRRLLDAAHLRMEDAGRRQSASNSAVKEGPDAETTGPSFAVLRRFFANGYQIRNLRTGDPVPDTGVLWILDIASQRGTGARVAIRVIPVLITRTLLNSVYTSQLLPYVNVLTLYLNILSYLNILACVSTPLFSGASRTRRRRLRLKGLAKMRDVIDAQWTRRQQLRRDKTSQDPEAPVAVVPGKRIIRARSERFDALLEQKGVNPVAGRAVAELKRIFERADRRVRRHRYARVLQSAARFGIYDPPESARLALSSMRHAANQDDAALTVDFDE